MHDAFPSRVGHPVVDVVVVVVDFVVVVDIDFLSTVCTEGFRCSVFSET